MVVIYEKRDKVAYITINRPQVMNAMDAETFDKLGEAIRDVDRDPKVWVAIVTGAGDKAFTSGADLKGYIGRDTGGPGQPYSSYQFYNLVPSIKPFIAAINGYCLAGGLELALSCDIRIASETASFGCPEVRWGILHGYGTLRLPRMIPMAEAMELLLIGDRIDAQKALRLGLVSRVVPPDQLMPTAEAIARRICENSPLAVRVTKELAYRGGELPHEEGLHLVHTAMSQLYATEDSKEGPRAFAEKRKPVYKAR
ncbi:MAG: enoyl-CoA hydratase/isomerase family protein [Dehalococcoidia bacterium]